MSTLSKISERTSEFAFSLDQMARSLEEREALYKDGHHNVEEALHDAELLDVANRNRAEVEKSLDQAFADLMELNLMFATQTADLLGERV